MRFPRIGSRMGPRIDLELTHIDLRYDLPDTLPDWSRDGPRYLPDWSRDGPRSNKALFRVLLTVAERITDPSKDWIAAPTRCQE